MKKVQKEATPDPEELAVEARVREMMEPTTAAENETPPATVNMPVPEIPDSKPTKRAITINLPDEKPIEPVSAPVVTKKVTKPKTSKKIAIALHEETAPELPKALKATPSPVTVPNIDLQQEKADVEPEQRAITEPNASAEEPGVPLLPDEALEAITNSEVEPVAPPTDEIPDASEPAAAPPTIIKRSTPRPIMDVARQPAVAETAADPLFKAEPLPPETPLPDLPPIYEDLETSRAVEDIIVSEGDELLHIQDAAAGRTEATEPLLHKKTSKPHVFARKTIVKLFLLLILIAAVVAMAVPQSRYYGLNKAGVRSNASVIVMDQSTLQPLKNVTVSIAGQSAKTGSDGQALLTAIPLGPAELKIEKDAFKTVTTSQTIGWGSNPLGEFKLDPTGLQYSLKIVDYISGKPVEGAEVVSGEISGLSDKEGIVKLTTLDKTATTREVTVSAGQYRAERVTISSDKDEKTVKLLLARKHVFITKKAGRFDVYRSDLDGKNEVRLLAGTGSERDNMVLVPHPTDEYVALISTRDNKRNDDNFLLSSLTLFNLNDDSSKILTSSERIQIVGWIGSRLLYVEIADGQSAASPNRHRLMAYDLQSQASKELTKTNVFNDVVIVQGKIYFAPASAYAAPDTTGLYRIDSDGTNRQRLLDKEVWNIFRSDYGQLQLSTPQDWYGYEINGQTTKLTAAPIDPKTRVYTDSPDGKHSLWTEIRDGKGTLLFYDLAGKEDSVIREQVGLGYPLRWINNETVVYRIVSPVETADYVMNIASGDARKIADVVNSAGIGSDYAN